MTFDHSPRRSLRRPRLTALLLGVALAATGCGGGGGGSHASAAAESKAGEVRRGGTVTYLSGPEAAGLDPVNLSTTAGSGHSPRGYAIYDMLLKLDQRTGKVVPGTAESVTSDDLTTWTLALKPGISFSDGTPYDAAAVKFNWERHADPANKSTQASTVALIASMDVVDAQTLRIVLTRPHSQWPYIVATGLPFIASPTAIKARGKGFSAAPVGAGPFVVREWRRDDQLVLDRNADYYGGEPPLETLIFKPIPDEQQRLDTAATTPAIARLNSSLTAERAKQAGLDVHVTQQNGGANFIMNMKRAPFDDVRVREALWLAFDSQDYDKVVLQGTGKVPASYFAPDSPFFDAGVTFPRPDLGRAQELVDAYTAETGKGVSFTLQTQNVPRAEYVQAAFQQLKGVTVQVQQLAGPQHIGNAFGHDFQATLLGVDFVYPAPIFHEEFRTGGTRNFGQYSSPVVDSALKRAETTADLDEQRTAYAEAQKQIIADFGEVLLTRLNGLDAVAEGVVVPTFWNDGIPAFDQVHLRS